jgi:hypothetical protein
VFNSVHLQPTDDSFQLSGGRIVTVPVTDFKEIVTRIFGDTSIKYYKNIMNSIDITSWRLIINVTNHENDNHAIKGDKLSEYLYRINMKNN